MRDPRCAVAALLVLFALPAFPESRRKTVEVAPPSKVAAAAAKTPQPSRGQDFYLHGGKPIVLERSMTEAVVRFVEGRGSAGVLLANAARTAKLTTEVRVEGRAFHIVSVPMTDGRSGVPAMMDQLRQSPDVEVVADVFIHRPSGKRIVATDEIVVKVKPGVTRDLLGEIAQPLDLRVDRTMHGVGDEFVLRALDGKRADVLALTRALNATAKLEWAEPNFIREYERYSAPNDPRFTNQWHLDNTGQAGGTAGADVKAKSAWDVETGSAAVVIAIVDDGVEKAHEDLAANIFTNPGEIPANGIDDDANGYIDDVHGWDFAKRDNNADPFSPGDSHGTSVAGVAAARGNNGTGVSGACQQCRILPVKLFSPDYAGDTAAANALRYAASFADVVNNSWGGGTPSAAIRSAIQTGRSQGRGGKGSAILFATGNYSSGYFLIAGSDLPAGTHRFRWTYSKDESFANRDDSAWLAWTSFPGGELVNFESGSMPDGWTTGGDGSWTVVNDPAHADEGYCYTHAAKSPALLDNQSSYVEVTKTLGAGAFNTFVWVASEFGYDGLTLDIDLGNDGSVDLSTDLLSGDPGTVDGVAYPAAFPESIAVGASSNKDCRSDYSQFGPELAFVAPSNGGPLNLAIDTTDRTGTAGYDDSSNYTSEFGGTSSATPLASGIAGLILSRNSSLTVPELLTAMQSTATKIGPEPYVSGRNDRYGYGRLNAQDALLGVAACASLSLTPAVLPAANRNSSYTANFTAGGGAATYTFSVPVGSLPPGLSMSANGVLSGTPTAQGTYSFTVRVLDANGCMGYRALNLVVGPPVAQPGGANLYLVTPCRIIDTRNADGPRGGPVLANLATRAVQVTGVCGIPSGAVAVAANVTAVSPSTTGFLALFPSDIQWPGNSTMSYRPGKTRANNAILRLSPSGQTSIHNNGAPQHFVIDVTGYFQ
jgi:subtilisin family serine protease